jgi:hypothetical protein
MAPSARDVDPAIRACRTWSDRQSEYAGLIKRWQALEAHLIKHHDWCRLSSRQRATMPEALELDAIDDRLDVIHDQKQQVLSNLPRIGATTPRGLAAKLAVAAKVINRHENAEAHELITSVLFEFRALAGIAAE